MAIDEEVANRVRSELSDRGIEWEEKRMFGALIFMVGGAIALGCRGGGGLLVRVDPSESEELLREAGPWYAQVALMGEKDMGPSWLDVSPDAVEDDAGLTHWVDAVLRR
ncbi:TfoX/Sxy family protein [Janibacter corallicola]|uniref:TfoX/Sxy family protein n=1 Tax=Janibacter corallicola TaxID=415212 RepID=UPI0008329B33|nr:TfoX/Sxy family protein [Janibacter corallicola]